MSDPLRLLDHSVAEFARRLASGDPTPGGGSASALSAALGASLVSMVANLTTGRPGTAEHDATLREITRGAASASSELLRLVDVDAAAYDAVVGARRLPRDDEGEAARAAAIRSAVVEATRVPLRIAARAADVLVLAERLAGIGNPRALSDVAVAADLAWTGLRGGLANVHANLPALAADDPLRAELAPQIEELERVAARGVEPIRATLAARNGS